MGRRGRGKKTETQIEGHGEDELDGGNGYIYEKEKEKEKEKGFFACYLLCSLSPRFKGHTYIGFTTNPRRRIRQHNGELTSGAIRTKKKRPWEMMLCIYGFPSNVSALQFEWAWQHPTQSLMVRKVAASFKSLSGIANKIKLAYTMLTLPSWENLNLTVNFFSSKYIKHVTGCPSLAKHMRVNVSLMEELPCYLEGQILDNNNNIDDFDEDGSNVSSMEELHCYLKGQIFDNNEDIDDCEKGDKDVLNVSIMNELPCNLKGQKTHDNDRTAHDCDEGDEDDSNVEEIYSESFDKSLLRSLEFDILTTRDASDDRLSPGKPDYSRGIESDKVESTIIIPNSIQSPMKASNESFRQRESCEFVGQQDKFWEKDASTTGRRSLLQLTELSTPIVYKSNKKRKSSSAVYSPENNVIDLITPSSNHKQQRSSSNHQPLIFPEFIDLTRSPVVCIQL